MEKEIQEFINKKQELQKSILDFIEHGETIIPNDQLSSILEDPILEEDKNEMKSTLYLISKIADNHHKNQFFYEKIEQILLRIKEKVTSKLTNSEIYEIFKSNKRVVLILIKEEFIEFDQILSQKIDNDKQLREQYHYYFYPELKEFIEDESNEQIRKFAHEISGNNFGLFEKKRKFGENDDKICELIQNDSIDEFTQYVEQQKTDLNELITPSVFETNSLLIDNKPNLIEYAAFFGSLNIFNYLLSKGIELKPSLWIYSIHSQNEELIRILQDKNIQFPNNSVQSCIDESIKCHHNELVNFFQNSQNNENVDVCSKSVKYLNYSFFPNDLNNIDSFYYLCQNDNLKLVEILLTNEDLKNQINTKVVSFLHLQKVYRYFLINDVYIICINAI